MKQVLMLEISNKLKAIQTDVAVIKTSNEKLEKNMERMTDQQQKTEERVKYLEDKLFALTKKAVINEQYHRRQSIRIFGVPETRQENCQQLVVDMCNNRLQKTLSPADLTSTHRITSSTKRQPIIAVFATHDMKMAILKERKKLKGSNQVISEDLCVELHQTLNRLNNDSRVAQAWSWDSRIFAKRHDGAVARIEWAQSLDDAFRKHDQQQQNHQEAT